MRTIPLTVTARGCIKAPNNAILGRAGELNASRVSFDVAAWTENTITTYSVAGKNAAGTSWVLETGLTATDGIVTLDMPVAMLATAGYAELEIRGEASGAIIKTAAAMLPVEAALTTGSAPADADPAWIDTLSQAAETVAAAADGLTAQVEAANTQLAAIVDGVSLAVDAGGDLVLTTPDGAANLGHVAGETGAIGPAGPNSISADTDSAITGLLKGAGGKAAQAVAGADYVTPGQLMRKLITRTIAAGENLASLTWTQTDAGAALALIEAKIVIFVPANGLAVGSSGYIQCRINDIATNYCSPSSDAGYSFNAAIFRSFNNVSTLSLYKIGVGVEGDLLYRYSDGTTRASAYQGTYCTLPVDTITKFYLFVSGIAAFPVGTVIDIYGRTE